MDNAPDRYEVADRSSLAQLAELQQSLEDEGRELQRALDERILFERAKRRVGVRFGLEQNEASELIRGLAGSQKRDLAEFCAEIVSCDGRLDGLSPQQPRFRT